MKARRTPSPRKQTNCPNLFLSHLEHALILLSPTPENLDVEGDEARSGSACEANARLRLRSQT